MRTVGMALLAALGATLLGGLVGWGVWVLRGQPHAEAPTLALVQPVAPPANSPDAYSRPRRTPDLRSNPKRGDGPARLAIVIDDIGQSVTQVEDFLALGVPITFSILPALPHTRDAAHRILRAQREYIIHMPMQPEDYPHQNPGPHPLMLELGLPETQRRVQEYMAELPNAVGASNHMGSAYTGDEAHMAVVQRELARNRLFFLNSKTSATSVPGRIAAQGGYPYLSRDVFLDNTREVQAIERELHRAVDRAQRRGQTIAIGHPYGETLTAIAGALGRGELQDVELVNLSELMRSRTD